MRHPCTWRRELAKLPKKCFVRKMKKHNVNYTSIDDLCLRLSLCKIATANSGKILIESSKANGAYNNKLHRFIFLGKYNVWEMTSERASCNDTSKWIACIRLEGKKTKVISKHFDKHSSLKVNTKRPLCSIEVRRLRFFLLVVWDGNRRCASRCDRMPFSYRHKMGCSVQT